MKKAHLLLALLFASQSVLFGASYSVDQSHSAVGFSVKHMLVTNTKGAFSDFKGTLEWDDTNVNRSKLKGIVKVESINTNNKKRDKHLRSGDFFDAKKYPDIKFETVSITKNTDNRYTAIADLTIKNITKKVTVPLTITPEIPSKGKKVVRGFIGEFEINRKDFGITWSKVVDNGVVVVSDKVKISFEIQGYRNK